MSYRRRTGVFVFCKFKAENDVFLHVFVIFSMTITDSFLFAPLHVLLKNVYRKIDELSLNNLPPASPKRGLCVAAGVEHKRRQL